MKGKLFGLVRGGLDGFCLSIMFVLTAVLAVHSSSFAAVDLSPWTYQREVKVTNSTTNAITNYPVKVVLSASNFNFASAKSDGADLRAVDSDKATLLSYYIESYNSSSQSAVVWVRVPSIPANGIATFYLYAGNSTATSLSDILARYEVYDDFTGTSLDTNQWEVIHYDGENHGYSGSVGVSSGNLQIVGGEHHIIDGIRGKKTFRAGGATIRAECFGYSRSGNSFCYSAPIWGINDGTGWTKVGTGADSAYNATGYVIYNNGGDTYWSSGFQDFYCISAPNQTYTGSDQTSVKVENGSARSSANSIAITYSSSIAKCYIDSSEKASITSNLPNANTDFRAQMWITNPYQGATTVTIDKIVVSRSLDQEPTVSVTESSSPPAVTTGSATNVTSSSATLNGTVNANGQSTTAWFNYGITSGAYTGTSTTQSVSGSSNTSVSSDISGLSSNTTYYYRIAASNSGGTSYGSEVSFTTSSAPTPTPTPTPTDTTAPSGSVSINSGASYTNSTAVTLTLTATDSVGVVGDYASTSSSTPTASASGWNSVTSTTSYSGSVSYSLASGDEQKTVYVWYKDAAGNVSSQASDSITLDTTAPIVTITSPTSSDTYTTTSNPLSLGGSASDSTSGISNVTCGLIVRVGVVLRAERLIGLFRT